MYEYACEPTGLCDTDQLRYVFFSLLGLRFHSNKY